MTTLRRPLGNVLVALKPSYPHRANTHRLTWPLPSSDHRIDVSVVGSGHSKNTSSQFAAWITQDTFALPTAGKRGAAEVAALGSRPPLNGPSRLARKSHSRGYGSTRPYGGAS